MPCYHPRSGWQAKEPNENGKRPVQFGTSQEFWQPGLIAVKIPCGRCIGCRLERSRQWAIRCVHEAQLHDKNSYITLTYDEDNLPQKGLIKSHFVKFMKDLRASIAYKEKHLPKDNRTKIKFFQAGEYGSICKLCKVGEKVHWKLGCNTFIPELGRPHFHACLFGHDFQDKELFSTARGVKLYTSNYLRSIWKKGHVTIGDVTFESAAYVARYITKKIFGEKAEEHYNGKLPEYTTMSRGGRTGKGIAHDWYSKFVTDVYPHDVVVLRGRKLQPPRYYDKLLERDNPQLLAELKAARRKKAEAATQKLLQEGQNPATRRKELECIKLQNNEQLKRSYEND